MLALAKLQLTTGDVDGCQQMCVSVLREDGDNEAGLYIHAECS
jgi:hypothetical protein